MKYHSLLIYILVSVIVFSSLFTYDLKFAVLWLLIYGVYYVLKYIALSHPTTKYLIRKLLVHSKWQWVIASSVTIFVTALISYYYVYTNYMSHARTTDTLWLLLLLGPLVACRRGSSTDTLLSLLHAFIALVLITLSFANSFESLLISTLPKACWLFVIILIVNTIIRYARDLYANLSLLEGISQALTEALTANDGAIPTTSQIYEVLAQQLQRSFGYPHVNVFERQVCPDRVRPAYGSRACV